MSIVRTYRRDEDGTMKFREAWFSTYEGEALGQFVVNHGTVGHLSTTGTAKDVNEETARGLLAATVTKPYWPTCVQFMPRSNRNMVGRACTRNCLHVGFVSAKNGCGT